MKFLKNLFKSKKEKWREKLLKDYEEGKVLKIETPNPQNNNSQNQNQNKHKHKNHHHDKRRN